MKICTLCGHRDNPYWRHSRFDYNADYMSWDDFKREFIVMAEMLQDKKNHEPLITNHYSYYKRGRTQLQVYRVANEDYKMPRERKQH